MENIKKKKNSFSPSSSSSFSSFESLSITDDAVVTGSTNFFPKHPSTLSFYRKKMMVGPRSPRCFLSDEDEGNRYFLDTCHLCKRPIGDGRDIFMYRGNMPFCSEECREEQIEMDEADEKRAKLSKNPPQKNSNSTSPSKIHVWFTGTVVAG